MVADFYNPNKVSSQYIGKDGCSRGAPRGGLLSLRAPPNRLCKLVNKMSLSVVVLNKRFTSICFNYINNCDQKNFTVICLGRKIGSGKM